jgi:hypothetical protein
VLPVEGLALEVLERGLEALEWELELEQVPELVLEPGKHQLVGLQGRLAHSADRLSLFCPPTRLLEWHSLATLLESVEH